MGGLNLREGLRRQAEGTRVVAGNDPLFHAAAMEWLEFLASRPEEFTADDLRLLLEDRGVAPRHPNSIGAAVRTAVGCGMIQRVGFQVSARPKARGRTVAVYLGKAYAP